MKSKRVLSLLLAMAGALLLLAGIFVFPGEAEKKAAGVCYGLGSSAFVLGLGWFILTFSKTLNAEAVQKQKAIAMADERNIRIRERTSLGVEKCTTYALILWIVLEGLLGGDILHILLPSALLALRFLCMVFFTNRYMKTM